MRFQSREYLLDTIKTYGPFNKVLDVGSAHINGNIRDCFSNSEYIGLDMRTGQNVDIAINAHDMVLFFGKRIFDLVVCFDTLEHDDKFWLTVEAMKKVLKKGGWLVIGVPAQNTELHDYPFDYWRFMRKGVETFFEGMKNVEI